MPFTVNAIACAVDCGRVPIVLTEPVSGSTSEIRSVSPPLARSPPATTSLSPTAATAAYRRPGAGPQPCDQPQRQLHTAGRWQARTVHERGPRRRRPDDRLRRDAVPTSDEVNG